jgi:hypothetical protein
MSPSDGMIPRAPVRSSNIASVGYDADSQRLHVEFANGGVYEHQGVPADVAAELRDAESVGSYYARNIRKGPYPARKLS